jgi:hypothetical protein
MPNLSGVEATGQGIRPSAVPSAETAARSSVDAAAPRRSLESGLLSAVEGPNRFGHDKRSLTRCGRRSSIEGGDRERG